MVNFFSSSVAAAVTLSPEIREIVDTCKNDLSLDACSTIRSTELGTDNAYCASTLFAPTCRVAERCGEAGYASIDQFGILQTIRATEWADTLDSLDEAVREKVGYGPRRAMMNLVKFERWACQSWAQLTDIDSIQLLNAAGYAYDRLTGDCHILLHRPSLDGKSVESVAADQVRRLRGYLWNAVDDEESTTGDVVPKEPAHPDEGASSISSDEVMTTESVHETEALARKNARTAGVRVISRAISGRRNCTCGTDGKPCRQVADEELDSVANCTGENFSWRDCMHIETSAIHGDAIGCVANFDNDRCVIFDAYPHCYRESLEFTVPEKHLRFGPSLDDTREFFAAQGTGFADFAGKLGFTNPQTAETGVRAKLMGPARGGAMACRAALIMRGNSGEQIEGVDMYAFDEDTEECFLFKEKDLSAETIRPTEAPLKRFIAGPAFC